MTVLDASVIVDELIADRPSELTTRSLRSGTACAPEALVPEVLSAIRRAERRGLVTRHRADGAIADLEALDVQLLPQRGLARRAFDLRANITCADALYVALAEALAEPLLTADAGLARAVRRHTDVTVLTTRP